MSESSAIFNKGVVARSLSSNQTGVTWDEELGMVRDFCRLADDAISAANVDKRMVATGTDWYFWKFTTWLGEQDNTWVEFAWRNYVTVKSFQGLNKPVSPDQKERILISGSFPTLVHSIPMRDNTRDYYWINSLDTRIMEDTLDVNDSVPSRAECTYNVLDIQDLDDGTYDGYFDSARIQSHDIITPTMNTLNKVLDSIRVGGVVLFYDVSGFGALYEDAASTHEESIHRFSRQVVSRDDFDVYHIPNELGVIIAHRIG